MSNKKFRYDYNNRMTIITFSLSIMFLFFALTYKNIIINVIFYLCSSGLLFVSLFIYRLFGLHLNSKKTHLVILDAINFHRKIATNEIKYIVAHEVKKEKKHSVYGFFCEYFTIFRSVDCDYTYNSGKVYEIKIYLKNGSCIKTIFAWMYRERNIKRVKKIETKLELFIREVNDELRLLK